MSRLIVTGASGFVGRALVARAPRAEALSLAGADWRARLAAAALRDASSVHLGGRAHAPAEDADRAFADGPEKARALAEAAARAGARVLVFASTIKVNGEESPGRPFTPDDGPHPEDAYGRSKLAAEDALREAAAATGLPVHIVRPPLVYGAHARGNLAALLRWCDTPWPLPFASIANRRSFVALPDLVALLLRCVERPMPGAPVWLAAHPSPIATARLIAEMRAALGRPLRLYPMPAAVLETAGRAIGRGALVRRLTRSLEVDASRTYAQMDWRPALDAPAAIRALVHRST